MTTSVACKTSYMTPPVGQYVSDSVNQKGCDQGQVNSSEFNLMEMTDVEYTHLQHIIQSHMEAQDVVEEVRLNPPSSTDPKIKTSCKVCPSLNMSPVCQPGSSSSSSLSSASSLSSSLPTDAQLIPVPSNQESEDGQEVKVLLYSDPSSLAVSMSTPDANTEVPCDPMVRLRYVTDTTRDRNYHQRVPLLASRPNPPARVRLESRFTCNLCDLNKKEESQTTVLNTFLSLLHNSTDMPGIAMHSQPENWSKAEKTGAEECAYAHLGNPGVSDVSQLSEDRKHPEGIESKSLGSQCIIYTDMMSEEHVISMENVAVPKTGRLTRKHEAQTLQAQDPTIMHESQKWAPVCLIPGRKAGQRTRATLDILKRKERHNLKERDRRRRIRLCCDELNMLVPFCRPETDKATTLQWSTAYLKYIREIYGDALKQDFQNTFCGKTGVRIKPSCTHDATECQNMASSE